MDEQHVWRRTGRMSRRFLSLEKEWKNMYEDMTKTSSGGWIWKNWVSIDEEKEDGLIRVGTIREEVGPLSSLPDRRGVAGDVGAATALVLLGQSEWSISLWLGGNVCVCAIFINIFIITNIIFSSSSRVRLKTLQSSHLNWQKWCQNFVHLMCNKKFKVYQFA